MTPLYEPTCEDCEAEGVVRLATEERGGSSLCPSCAEKRDEASYEAWQAARLEA